MQLAASHEKERGLAAVAGSVTSGSSGSFTQLRMDDEERAQGHRALMNANKKARALPRAPGCVLCGFSAIRCGAAWAHLCHHFHGSNKVPQTPQLVLRCSKYSRVPTIYEPCRPVERKR